MTLYQLCSCYCSSLIEPMSLHFSSRCEITYRALSHYLLEQITALRSLQCSGHLIMQHPHAYTQTCSHARSLSLHTHTRMPLHSRTNTRVCTRARTIPRHPLRQERIRARMHSHMRAGARIRSLSHTPAHTHTHVRAHIQTHSLMRADAHTLARRRKYSRSLSHKHERTHAHTPCIQMRASASTHNFTHT